MYIDWLLTAFFHHHTYHSFFRLTRRDKLVPCYIVHRQEHNFCPGKWTGLMNTNLYHPKKITMYVRPLSSYTIIKSTIKILLDVNINLSQLIWNQIHSIKFLMFSDFVNCPKKSSQNNPDTNIILISQKKSLKMK